MAKIIIENNQGVMEMVMKVVGLGHRHQLAGRIRLESANRSPVFQRGENTNTDDISRPVGPLETQAAAT